MFNELGRLGEWRHGNPLEVLRQYKVQESKLAFLNQDEIERLLATCAGLKDLWLIVMRCLSPPAPAGQR